MTATATPSCVKQDSPDSALAALATIGLYHAIPLTLPGIRKLTGFDKQNLDSLQILLASSKCGLTAVPLEGEFDQLSEVHLPCIATFRNSQYQVLFDVDTSSAMIGDTTTGKVNRISRADFCERWTGEVFQVEPNDEIDAARDTLRRLQDPVWMVARVLGAVPFTAQRLLFAAILCAWISSLFWAPMLAVLTGACHLASLWMAAYPRGCRRCAATSRVSGSLQVPWLGAGFYAVLTAAVLLDARNLVWLGLLAAAGAHLALVSILLRHRTVCYPCLGLAATVWLALGVAFTHQAPHAAGAEVLILPISAGVALLAITIATRLARYESQDELLALAERVAAEEFAAGEGRARLVIYSLKTCPNCIFFKNAVRPLLAEEFGDALEIEDRDPGKMKVAVPIFFVTGATKIFLASVPTEEMLSRINEAIQIAMDPASARVGALGGFHMVGLPDGKA